MKTNKILSLQPEITIPNRLSMPAVEESICTNGIPLHILREHSSIDVTRLSLVFKAGTTTQNIPFSASTALAMISEGCEGLSSEQIAEQLDFLGSYFDTSIDRDFSVITICSLSKFFPQTLEILSKLLLTPTFPEDKLSILTQSRKQRLSVQRTKSGHIAREHFGAALFGYDHPYGSFSDHNLYDNLQREHLIEFFRRQYTCSNCFAVIGGRVSDEDIDATKGLLTSLPQPTELTISQRTMASPITTAHTYVPFEGVQSAIRVGRLLFPRNHPDFVPMQVLSTLLGGYFGSRLITNLRVQHGYTYGVLSTMVNLQQAGYLAIATEVGADATRNSIDEIFKEFDRLCNEPVDREELTMVKHVMIGELLRIMDGPFGIMDIAIENIQNEQDQDYISRFCAQINEITPQQIQELAQKYLQAEQMATIVVGPQKV